MRKKRTRQALRTAESSEDGNAESREQQVCSNRRQDTSGRDDKRRKTGVPSRRRGRSAPGAPD